VKRFLQVPPRAKNNPGLELPPIFSKVHIYSYTNLSWQSDILGEIHPQQKREDFPASKVKLPQPSVQGDGLRGNYKEGEHHVGEGRNIFFVSKRKVEIFVFLFVCLGCGLFVCLGCGLAIRV
jgi:hypothetical protein